MVLLKMLMEMALPKMGELLVMTMAMISPSGSESTCAPWVILVINVNISLVGLVLLSSIFQRVQQRRGMDKRMWNPFKMLRTHVGKSSRLYIFHFSDPRSH
jgi:hypothetical protein